LAESLTRHRRDVSAMVVKGLVERDAVGRLMLSGEGRATVAVLLKAD
jgi:hypothetical protein